MPNQFNEPDFMSNTEQPIEVQRAMPFSNEAEQSVIGSMFLDKECIPDVVSKVRSTDFYIDRHKELFDAIVELYNLGKPVDLVTIEEQLTLRGSLDKIGGIRFVVDVANTVPSTENVRYYADIVKEKAILRSLIRLADNISSSSYKGDEETDDILARAQQGIIDISQGRETKGLVHIGRYLNESIEHIDRLSQRDNTVSGVPTGFVDIDRRTSGLHAAELIVLAARPGMGKTSFVLNIAQNAAVKY
ncbi:MAG: DnaB-like helicase N-terminal domain-containing protein, partial [Clostridia bacterium]|nr:DnaB-like helicase N-terminal domain-containing protein [Clostridia bacterium]